MNKHICIHGHFYQPPRENPWLEEIELQESAYPFSNWNERINAECYAPNTASRIFDQERIIQIINNYSRISFNFGPTLLSWMEKKAPKVYNAILEADRDSRRIYSGHGSALAQVYNHIIMPLANDRDKHTQVIWGIKDFEFRFNRKPEGMWLAETAVDTPTLEALARHGIKFTILAPRQAKRVRRIGDGTWHDVMGEKLDSRRPYLCQLPSGATISLFFYDGMISQDLAFGGLVYNGENIARRLLAVFNEDEQEPMLANIATDGETYGHHHRFADRSLSYCVHYVESNNLAQMTIYGDFLEKHPPVYEVEIVENTSWSCYHGIERWRRDCGCNSGRPVWKQAWREPLRNALDWLRDELAKIFEKELKDFVKNPWALRNDYIEIILNRKEDRVEKFLAEKVRDDLTREEKTKILRLLEMQRHGLLMYTSCGWFFDEISGIETVQIIQYAARAIQIAYEVCGKNLEDYFLEYLAQAPSNIPEIENGAKVYEYFVKPAVVDLMRVGAHYAISSLFEDYPKKIDLYSYTALSDVHIVNEAGNRRLAFGRVRLKSNITLDERAITYAVFHLGDHNLHAGIREYVDDEKFEQMQKKISEPFELSDVPQVIQVINEEFDNNNYSLWHLFRDENRKVFNHILESTLEEMDVYFRQIYDNQYPIMTAMGNMRSALPKPLKTAAEFTLNNEVRRIIESDEQMDLNRLERIGDEVKRFSIDLDTLQLGLVATQKINDLVDQFKIDPENLELLRSVQESVSVLSRMPMELNFWNSQNEMFWIAKTYYNNKHVDAESGDEDAHEWIELFNKLADSLRVKV